MRTTIEHHFPDLFDQLRVIDDVRDESKASDYELAAHLTACLALFLFELGSRNQWTQKRKKLQFRRNYKKLFGFDMPHGDSMHRVISALLVSTNRKISVCLKELNTFMRRVRALMVHVGYVKTGWKQGKA